VCDINVCCLTLFTGEKNINNAQELTVAVSSQQDMWVLQMAVYVQTRLDNQNELVPLHYKCSKQRKL
jgi:hypothetical protein